MAKEDEVKKALDKRQNIERQYIEDNKTSPRLRDNLTDEELDVVKADAEKMAQAKSQAKAGTVDGKIDIEAMGDVKGDGGDAKDYADDDPDKALGVPVYEHGLHENRAGQEMSIPRETRISQRTLDEQARGAEVAKGHKAARDRARDLDDKTVVTRTNPLEPAPLVATKATAKK